MKRTEIEKKIASNDKLVAKLKEEVKTMRSDAKKQAEKIIKQYLPDWQLDEFDSSVMSFSKGSAFYRITIFHGAHDKLVDGKMKTVFKFELSVSSYGSFGLMDDSEQDCNIRCYYTAIALIINNEEFKQSLYNLLHGYYIEYNTKCDQIYNLHKESDELFKSMTMEDNQIKQEKIKETVKNAGHGYLIIDFAGSNPQLCEYKGRKCSLVLEDVSPDWDSLTSKLKELRKADKAKNHDYKVISTKTIKL